jgi:hypothetical protein
LSPRRQHIKGCSGTKRSGVETYVVAHIERQVCDGAKNSGDIAPNQFYTSPLSESGY